MPEVAGHGVVDRVDIGHCVDEADAAGRPAFGDEHVGVPAAVAGYW
jgi:hypothetical protein